MYRSILRSLSAVCLATALFMVGAAMAEPKAPTEEESADASFAKSFIGKTFSRDLEVEGWADFGGGLVSPPIWVHQYQREDGTVLVLTSKETAPASRGSPASYVVTDARIISKPWKGYAISIACMQGEDFTLRFIGDARGPADNEWWTDVRRAWEISLETGEIADVKTKGITCTNMSWGQ